MSESATIEFEALVEVARSFGIEHLGVTDASVLDRARTELYRRKEAGLADTLGFTYRNPDRSTDPERTYAGAKSVIAAAWPYYSPDTEPEPGVQMHIAKYARTEVYEELRSALRGVQKWIKKAGYKGVVFVDDNSIVDREVAWRAGLGWFGKNANILLPGAGSWFVLGCLVTTADIKAPKRRIPDGCGTCVRCIEACPTGAIVADGVIDARRCLSWVLQKPGSIDPQFRDVLGTRIYGCDDCQDACPPNTRFAVPVQIKVPSREWMPALRVLEMSDEELLKEFDALYIADRDPRWLRRNALVALGNAASPSDSRAQDALERYASGEDEILSEHALWALQRTRRNPA